MAATGSLSYYGPLVVWKPVTYIDPHDSVINRIVPNDEQHAESATERVNLLSNCTTKK